MGVAAGGWKDTLRLEHPMQVTWPSVMVEAALVLYQSLEVHLLNRKLLDGFCLLLEGLS